MVSFDVRISPWAKAQLEVLRAFDHVRIIEAIDEHLVHEPLETLTEGNSRGVFAHVPNAHFTSFPAAPNFARCFHATSCGQCRELFRAPLRCGHQSANPNRG
jgi:hypothetical protein